MTQEKGPEKNDDIDGSSLTLLELVTEIDNISKDFDNKSTLYRKLPSTLALKQLIKSTIAKEISIRNAVSYILESEPNTPLEEKARMILTILEDDDKKRVDTFRDLTEKCAFQEADISLDSLIQYLQEKSYEEVSLEDTVMGIMNLHQNNRDFDMKSFLDIVDTTKNAKILDTGKRLGRLTAKLGAYGAAAATGAWIATRHIRK